ncbi:MAG: efflux RND transporter permease subunit, partial [Bacteroidetes bacterium]
MLQKIIHFSVQQKLVTTFLVCVLIVVGLYQLKKLPIDAIPDITNNQIEVITSAPAYGAIDIERLVTYPIEQANTNIPGLKEIRSFSRFGLSLVTIVFDDKVDVYWARQQISERLLTLQSVIPAHIGTPVLGPVSSGLSEVYQYVLRPKHGYEQKYTLTELRSLQDWVVRRQLLGLPGVADVSSFGGKLKQYTIEVLPQRLKSYQLSIANIIDAVEKNNENTGGAYIEKGPQVLYIKTEGLAKSVADLEQIVVGTTHMQTPILVKDVAKVTIGEATRYGALTYNDEGEVAGGIVMMLKGANSSTVIEAIKKRVEQIQTTLPKGVVLEPFLDRTKMVKNAISTVKTNLLEGALIVTLVLVLFLGSWQAGLVVASVIPLSLLFAVCLMNLFGVNGNLMSLGALDFGLIVDGAVIIVEATLAYLYTNAAYRGTQLNQNTMNTEVTQAASDMMRSAVFGQLIIVMVYLPIFSLQGIEGKMFKPMAQTVVFALLGAFLLSITYVPMVTSWLISKKIPVKHNKSEEILHALSLWYAGILQKSFLYGKWIVGTAILLFAGSLYWLSTLGGEFIPTLEEGDFAVDTRVLTGSNLSTTIAYTQRAAGLLKKSFPEVEKVVTKIGSGEIPTDPMPMEASDMMVVLKDKSQWTSATSFDELAQKMSDTLQAVPGITAGFQYPVQMRFNELMTGARQDVVVKLFGENLDTLAHYAAILGKLAANTKGAINVYVEPLNGLPQLAIKFNRSLLAQYHISIADANAVVNASLAGKIVGAVYEDEKRYDAVVRVAKTAKQDEDAIKMLLVPTNTGQQIPLYAIADVVVEKSTNQIQREDAKRRIIVGFNVGNSDIATVVNEFQQKVSKQVKLPTGYYITYGGSFENLNAANERLKIAVPAALFLILLLLYSAFGNVKDSLLVFSAIPLSAIGGIAFLALRGLPFSISAAIGFIALFGVAVLNGIVLLTEVKKQIPLQPTLLKALEKAAELRLRPVLMTATVASVGFLPMALSNGSGAEVQRPLATVVIGGIISATVLTLIVLPVLYYLIHTSKRFMPKKIIAVLLCTLSVSAWAQTPENLSKITYQQCVDSALANNALNKAASLNTKATQQQI